MHLARQSSQHVSGDQDARCLELNQWTRNYLNLPSHTWMAGHTTGVTEMPEDTSMGKEKGAGHR